MSILSSLCCPLCSSQDVNGYHQDSRRNYFQCHVCQLVFVDPQQRLNAEQEKSEYDLHQNNSADQGYRQFLNRLYQPMLRQLPSCANGLDFGCGPGPTLSLMFEEAGHTMAIYDPFYFNDKAVLTVPYDFITATEVMEHVYQPKQILEQLWQCLKPGAVLGLMTKLVTDQDGFSRWHYKNDLTHVCFYSEKTFTFLASALQAELSIIGNDVIILRKNKSSECGSLGF